ncbi:transcription initiation factor TFIID subunit 1 isoform X1 [Acyrthosiphon pisum]|uniref:Transcription initiation factor TFIID subunit 1 n=1 Tax=Acyrthosiphon pisum TaxID=7029 RepID=A0A8R2A4C6_ACYPI|nr:transcription initiation factor TFIID subunit 1 isoform X1 [Acyrthosiphon pisum]|eukprot:XP_003241670.1 PREDICTED: transcription initiation factor TFIID subunit 1 isoform X1 [Acyrthosiphon pisum]
MNDDSSSEAQQGDFDLTSFMFGNIDESGQLEDDDLLDKDTKKYLASLSKLGFSSMVSEVIDSSELRGIENGHEDTNTVEEKSPTAQDYFDIDELAEETAGFKQKVLESGYDGDNEQNDKPTDRSKRLETPLAAMLPSKYENVDVTTLFPDFRVGKVLRFSRLFKPNKSSRLPKVWRNVKTKRKKRRHSDANDYNYSDNETKPQVLCLDYGSLPDPELIACDDEEKFLQPIESFSKQTNQNRQENEDGSNNQAYWRGGPAKLWYDMLGVPENGEEFDYGFKLKDNKTEDIENNAEENPYPEDAYLMVSQLHWEDDIIWNGEDIKHKVLQKLNSKTNAAGWVPSSTNRTAQAFSQPGKGMLPLAGGSVRLATSNINVSQSQNKMTPKSNLGSKQQPINDTTDDTWYSIFPVENEELVYGTWEDEIIWDAKNMEKIPRPKILTLDPNDENIILGVPDDVDPAKQRLDNATPVKVKIPHPHVKKSKLLLGKAGVINVLEEDTPLPPPKSPDRDPFNVSNDCYYQPRSSETSLRLKVGGGNIIQHSTPVVELKAPFVQTHMGPMRLRNFHRPPMKRYSHGAVAQPIFHSVQPLLKNIKKKAKLREQERIASGGGDVFFMRTPDDLTGRDGSIILVEYCEEHPPLLNQVGMCSKIKNYYKRKIGKDPGPPSLRFGEIAYAHTSPFLGVLSPGRTIQVIENNLYRTPIYEHKPLENDFLLIRTRHAYYIREIDALFTSGQLCPLYEVPGPNSKRANNFVRDFLQVFIYRLFWKSTDYPRRIKMDDIKKAFPSHSESSIRKRLKLCADFKRTGSDSNWWVIKPDFRLPSEEEIRAMVSPEQCCAYFSMIAAEQRLKDAGYGEKFILTSLEDDDEEMQLKMDDEIKVAPWMTTRAYIQAMKNKCLLQLTGPADPTGCGEGFSYVRVPNKPTLNKEEQEAQPKRMVTGTDADLRRLSLNNAKALLRKFAVPEEEIKKLSRWEVIDVVRTLSTEKAKAGEEGMTKFSRGNRFSIAEHQERYKEECQRIFDLQNRVLSSHELLSTDEGESFDEEDCSDIEEMGKNIENMLSNKKTSTQLSLEKEEQERHELRKMIMGCSSNDDLRKRDKKKMDDDDSMQFSSTGQPGRVLRIYRTFQGSDGKEYTRTEVVRKPGVIDAYLKIRTTRDEGFIRQYALMDEAQKEEMKREKRRIQEQLRRIKRNQERERFSNNTRPQPGFGYSMVNKSNSLSNDVPMPTSGTVTIPKPRIEATPPRPRKPKPSKMKPDLKVRCGACGNVGHMRTNKACPQYNLNPNASVNVALTEEQEEEIEKQMNVEDEDLVNVDGTKVTLSSKLLKHAEEVKRRSLVLKVPKDALSRNKKRKNELHCDYLKKPDRSANRRRTDPLIVLSTIFESILNEMRGMPDVHPFIYPVNVKKVPDYYNIVQRPMDLQSIRDGLHLKKYQNREEFLSDVNQIVENSTLYNGAKSSLTVAARRMLGVCVDRLHEKEERLMLLEKAINPLLDDNDQVALTFILDNVVGKVKTMSEAWPFMKPVNRKLVKDYYNVIKQPIDLETIASRVSSHKYHNRKEFLGDINLIFENSVAYNGEDSDFTQQAKKLISVATESLEEFDQYLTQVEQNISLVQARALEQVEMDSAAEDDYSDMQDVEDNLNSPREHKVNIEDIEFQMDPDSNFKTETNHILEDDLHCSSEEDDFMEVVGENPPDDDSQQVAEAMVLLGNMGYNPAPETFSNHIQADESMDLDPNYDPSDFLPTGSRNLDTSDEKDLPGSSSKSHASANIQDDLEISDSDEDSPHDDSLEIKTEGDLGELWF